MSQKADKSFLVGLFRAYLAEAGYGVFAEKFDTGIGELGRIRVERVSESGECVPESGERLTDLIDGLLCDCLVRPGGEDDMVYFMLKRAFGGGEPLVHKFKAVGLGGIRSLSELTIKLAAMVRSL